MHVPETDTSCSPNRDVAATMVLNPFLVETFMTMMSSHLNGHALQYLEGTIQFYFAGEVDGSCFCIIKNGSIETRAGVAPRADLILSGPFGLWREIVKGTADAYQMLVDGRVQAFGDIPLMQIFVRQPSVRLNQKPRTLVRTRSPLPYQYK
jgi:putative sterol carrier protein